MRYHTLTDGEWVEPYRRRYYLKCCDCGLVHRLNFRVLKGAVHFQAFRVKGSGRKRR